MTGPVRAGVFRAFLIAVSIGCISAGARAIGGGGERTYRAANLQRAEFERAPY